MVNNLKCEKCKKFNVCSMFSSKVKPFTEYAKHPVDIEITMDNCGEFDEVNSEMDSEDY